MAMHSGPGPPKGPPPSTDGPPPPRRFTYPPADERGTRTLALYEPVPGKAGAQLGRCGDCGFLARRAADASGHVEGVPNEDRQRIVALLQLAAGGSAMPWCYVGAADLPREFDDRMEHPEPAVAGEDPWLQEKFALGGILYGHRHCPEWWPYRDPETPAEHRRERDMMRLEEQRAAREERLAALEREGRTSSEKIQADSLEISRTLASIASSTDRFQRRWTRTAVALSIAALVIIGAAYLFPELGRHIGQWIDALLGYPLGRT